MAAMISSGVVVEGTARLTMFVLRAPHTTLDKWELFARDCFAVVQPHLGDWITVDFAALAGDAHDAFLAQLGASSGSDVLLALCHGTSDALLMPRDRRYLAKEHCALLRGKFAYLVACSAAGAFGPEAIAQGAIGYIGFSDVILGVPLVREDLQRKALMSGLVAYLEGKSIPEAARILKKKLSDAAHKLGTETKTPVQDAFVVGTLVTCAQRVKYGVAA